VCFYKLCLTPGILAFLKVWYKIRKLSGFLRHGDVILMFLLLSLLHGCMCTHLCVRGEREFPSVMGTYENFNDFHEDWYEHHATRSCINNIISLPRNEQYRKRNSSQIQTEVYYYHLMRIIECYVLIDF
jgi:hypothetical protein